MKWTIGQNSDRAIMSKLVVYTRDGQTQSRLDQDQPNRTDRLGFRTDSIGTSSVRFNLDPLPNRFGLLSWSKTVDSGPSRGSTRLYRLGPT